MSLPRSAAMVVSSDNSTTTGCQVQGFFDLGWPWQSMLEVTDKLSKVLLKLWMSHLSRLFLRPNMGLHNYGRLHESTASQGVKATLP